MVFIGLFSHDFLYFFTFLTKSAKDKGKIIEIMKKSLDKIKMLIGINKIDILYETLKFFSEILNSHRELVLNQKHEVDKILNGIQDWLAKIMTEQKELKTLIGKILPLILEIIEEFFTKNPNSEGIFEYCEIVFDILQNVKIRVF